MQLQVVLFCKDAKVLTGHCLHRMEANFEYYFRVYTLCFQLGLKLAMNCEGLQHVIGVSAPGCNLSQSPRLSCECTVLK